MKCRNASTSTSRSVLESSTKMAFKFVVFATLLAAANAGLLAAPQLSPLSYGAYAAPLPPLAYSAPIAKVATPLLAKTPVIAKTLIPEEYDPHPQYNYGYDVQDGLTGDNKEQHEQRDGDIVTGRYALNDPDGYRRIVEYTADPIHGFNAVVRREPLTAQVVAKVATPVVTKVATPLTYSAPLLTKTLATPVAYAAPAPLAYPAPIAKFATPLAYASPTIYHH